MATMKFTTNKYCSLMFTAAIFCSLHCQTDAGTMSITNLDSNPAYVAKFSYQSGGSPTGGGGSSMYDYSESGWVFSGWQKIAPGATYRGKAGFYRVELEGKEMTWKNQRVNIGYIHPTNKFSEKVTKLYRARDVARLKAKGNFVDYRYFEGGHTITGDRSFRVTSTTATFRFESRGRSSISNKQRHVPGHITGFSVDANSKYTSGIDWSLADWNSIELNGRLNGGKKRPFGPNEKAYYVGTVTIHYTVLNLPTFTGQ